MLSPAYPDNKLLPMFSRLLGRLTPTPAVVKTDAAVLMRKFGDEAESVARKREVDAGAHAKHWRLVDCHVACLCLAPVRMAEANAAATMEPAGELFANWFGQGQMSDYKGRVGRSRRKVRLGSIYAIQPTASRTIFIRGDTSRDEIKRPIVPFSFFSSGEDSPVGSHSHVQLLSRLDRDGSCLTSATSPLWGPALSDRLGPLSSPGRA